MWWPLAGSWLLMSMEGPLISAIIARLADPKVNLAAYGGIILPVSLIVEAPIIMLLAASTAMSKDLASYKKLHRFMMYLSAVLTVLHALIAFTPLYYFVVNQLIGVPPELVAPGRVGLMIMLPWTWAIGYRRFNQGVMIRFGYSGGVMACSAIRLTTISVMLFAGYLIGSIPGVIVATVAQALGVTLEGLYAGLRVRPIVNKELRDAPPAEPITWRGFAAFYIPLVFTSLLQFIGQPIGSAALSRMPDAINSLAVWSVVSNFIFLTRSVGVAYNEVVVALLDEKGSFFNLRRFAYYLAGALTLIIVVITITPLSSLWFEQMTGLSAALSQMAKNSLWLILLLPAMSVFQSWYQGSILTSRKTRGITESVVVYLVTISAVLFGGVLWGRTTGLYVAALAFALSNLSQTAWMLLRSRKIRKIVKQRDLDLLSPTEIQP